MLTTTCEVVVIATTPFHAPSSSVLKWKEDVQERRRKIHLNMEDITTVFSTSCLCCSWWSRIPRCCAGGGVLASWKEKTTHYIMRKLYLNRRQDAQHHQSQRGSGQALCQRIQPDWGCQIIFVGCVQCTWKPMKTSSPMSKSPSQLRFPTLQFFCKQWRTKN